MSDLYTRPMHVSIFVTASLAGTKSEGGLEDNRRWSVAGVGG